MSTDPSYTVFIRLPFPRGGFVDPPSVEWDAAKEKALWKILSKASKNSDIDWDEQAIKFDVPLPFLLQQTAWIYERQLVQVRAQMRKVGQPKGTSSAAPSPVPGCTSESAAAAGEAMKRTGSGGGVRVPSSLSARRDSPVPKAEGLGLVSGLGRANAPPISRTSSANTTVTTRNLPQPQISPRPATATLYRPTNVTPTHKTNPPSTSPLSAQSSSPAASSSSGATSSSDEGPAPAQSRILRRPRFSNKLGQSEDADDDEDEPAFMPFSTTGTSGQGHDPSATLRGDLRNLGGKRPVNTHRKSMEVVQNHQRGMNSQTSDSSASSALAMQPRRGEGAVGKDGTRIGGGRGLTGPLSPKRTAQLSGKGREGSEGSPSMGSSFSDLDDASVTQSALEEALASNMQAGGGMASRMSTISQALRSKYL